MKSIVPYEHELLLSFSGLLNELNPVGLLVNSVMQSYRFEYCRITALQGMTLIGRIIDSIIL